MLLGLAANANLAGRLTTSLSVPGSESARAEAILAAHFSDSIEGDFSVVAPSSRAHAARDETRLKAAVAATPGFILAQVRVEGGLLLAGITSPYSLSEAAARTAAFRHALAAAHLRGALVTGPAALQHDITPVLASDLHRGELIGGLLALALSAAVLGVGAMALVPLLVAGAGIALALLGAQLLSHLVSLVLYTQNVVILVGLGLGVDYSLLYLRRIRDEAAAGASDPLGAAAGARRTILVAALVATTGLASMLAVPVPFLRSLGVAGLVVPGAAATAALSLVPVLARVRARARTHRRGAGAAWARLARVVTRHPRRTLIGSLLALGLLSAPALGLSLSAGSLSAVPSGLESTRALALIESHVGTGVVAPLQIVVSDPTGSVNAARVQRSRLALARAVLSMNDVEVVAIGDAAPYVDASGHDARIIVVTRQDFTSPLTSELVAHVRAAVGAAHFPAGVSVEVGGAPAQARDFVERIGAALPWVILGALVLAGLVLYLAFASWPVALLAIGLDLISVASALGVMVGVTRYGVLAGLLHTYRVNAVEAWVPVFLFAVLFGLSMDYEVFVVSALAEARGEGLHGTNAVARALVSTGPVVTGAAGVMVAALVGLIIGRVAGLQELGLGLAAGVGIDALLVRTLVLPAALSLLSERSGPRAPAGSRGARGRRVPT